MERAVRLVLNVGVGFWVARHLGPSEYGILSYAIALVGIALCLAEGGLDGFVRRAVIEAPPEAARWLATAFLLRLAGAVTGYLLVLLIAWFGAASATELPLVLIVGLVLFQPVLFVPELWFQARLRAHYSVQAQITGLIAGASLRLYLIFHQGLLIGFAWALVVEMLVTGVALWMQTRRVGLFWHVQQAERFIARRLWADAWPLLLSGLAVMLYLRMDAIMLRAMAGERAVGLYTAASRFTEIWYFVPAALGSTLLPSLLRERERSPRDYTVFLQAYYDVSAAIGLMVAAACSLTAPWLIDLAYGPAYRDAALVLTLHVWSSVFVFLGVARGQFLLNERLTRFYFAATVAGLITNGVLNLILIPRAGPAGAAIATVIAQAVASWLSSFCHAAVRTNGWMQTRALLIPVRFPAYLR